jgi:chaperonin GroES
LWCGITDDSYCGVRLDSIIRRSYNTRALLQFKEKIFDMTSNTSESTSIKPLQDRVVVRRLTEDEAGTKSASGIIVPDTVSKEKPEQGIVVAVGDGKWDEDGEKRIPMDVKVGDRIIFSKYGFDEVKIAGEELYIVSASSILGIIN